MRTYKLLRDANKMSVVRHKSVVNRFASTYIDCHLRLRCDNLAALKRLPRQSVRDRRLEAG